MCTRMHFCRLGIRWAGSGQFAGCHLPRSYMKIGGVSRIALHKMRGMICKLNNPSVEALRLETASPPTIVKNARGTALHELEAISGTGDDLYRGNARHHAVARR